MIELISSLSKSNSSKFWNWRNIETIHLCKLCTLVNIKLTQPVIFGIAFLERPRQSHDHSLVPQLFQKKKLILPPPSNLEKVSSCSSWCNFSMHSSILFQICSLFFLKLRGVYQFSSISVTVFDEILVVLDSFHMKRKKDQPGCYISTFALVILIFIG